MKSANPRFWGLASLTSLALYAGAGHAAVSAAWLPPETSLAPGEVTEVICRTAWESGDGPINVLPVETPSTDWGTLVLLRTESGFDGDAVYVDQVFEVSAAAPGEYVLPALDIVYVVDEQEDLDGAPRVQSSPLTIEVRESNQAFYSAGAAAAVVAFLAVTFITIRLRSARTGQRMQPSEHGPNLDNARAALHRARALRIDGDFYGCYRALGEAVADLEGNNQSLADDLAARAQAAGYGGTRPDETSLDADFRAVERALNHAESEEDSEPAAQQKAGEL